MVDALTVAMLFDSGQTYSGQAYRDCIASARTHRVPIVVARRGMRWDSGDGVALDWIVAIRLQRSDRWSDDARSLRG
jgi:hypothetical protein